MANHLFPASSRSVLSFSVAFRWIALRNRRNWLTFNLKIALYHRAWLIPSRTELGAFWATSKISFSHTVWNKEKNAHTHTHTHTILFCGNRAVYSDGLDRKFDLKCASWLWGDEKLVRLFSFPLNRVLFQMMSYLFEHAGFIPFILFFV